ncbi:hypothetical protein B0H63DRAFT_539924 [Podospora didyma]|uniref:Uncharacterized protein n=1 Tax=Podospora didyma TaxID=330526 RepID=A0AAE0P1D1_9PEZI|nr:hypothetical protein B0H63DRAFT_539924 [Podospora didyma]
MDNQHLVCVFYGGRFVLSKRGLGSGDPGTQGATLIQFLRIPTNVQSLKDGLQFIYEPSELQRVTVERDIVEARTQFYRLYGREPVYVEDCCRVMDALCPPLSRYTSAGILQIIAQAKAGREVPIVFKLPDKEYWISGRWTYVVDLDRSILEVFYDSEDNKLGHRFEGVGVDDVPAFITSLTFSDLQIKDSAGEIPSEIVKWRGEYLYAFYPSSILTNNLQSLSRPQDFFRTLAILKTVRQD